MKRFKLVMALLISYVIGIYAQQDFSDYWTRNTESSSFTLNITQIGDSIKGSICAVIHNGDFIDCAAGEEDEGFISVKGTVSGNIATVDFFSSYASGWGINTAWGKATITKISDTQIKWEITVEPSGGTCFIPSESVLTNQTEE